MNSRLLLLVIAAPLCACPLRADEKPLPAPLQPYAAFVAQCERYAAEMPRFGGDFVEEFATNSSNWQAIPSTTRQPKLALRKVDGRSVLAITASSTAEASVVVGSPWIGDSRIEMVACSDADTPCDLSLFLGPIGSAPGFQFGGHNNTRNCLWTDGGADSRWHTVELPAQPLITPRHWHTVRLERVGRDLIGSVDDQEIGRTQLSDRFDLERPYQPMIYCYDTTIFVDRVTIARPEQGDAAARKAEAWQKAFGDLTAADVDKKLGELVALLDHKSSQVRDGAQGLLTQIRPVALPALQRILAAGTFEQQLRAREILRGTPSSPP